MLILGISCYYHDSAACLLRDGKIVAAAEEEKFSRVKHDASFPHQAIAYCLNVAGATVADIEVVAFYEKPFLKFERLLETFLHQAPRGFSSFLKAMPLWLKNRLWMRSRLKEELGYSGRILYPEHHQSHAAAAFFASPFAEAAVLTVDGVGEWATTSVGWGRASQIELLASLDFPDSLGLLYSAFTAYLGFKVNSGEYKVMGLAPYGKPTFRDRIESQLIEVRPDGSFRLNRNYFNFSSSETLANPAFNELFEGPPRRPEEPLTERHHHLARSIQLVLEERMLALANEAHQRTRSSNLCLSGGVALNCVANGRLLREGPFKKIWIQPAAGDAGGALGAALFAWHQALGHSRPSTGLDFQAGSFLGPNLDVSEAEAFFQSEGIPFQKFSPSQTVEQAAQGIMRGEVWGWCEGRMEFGPRALGHRSILADPRNPKMKDRINAQVKQREGFRPFGASVLRDRVEVLVEQAADSPYMILTGQARSQVDPQGQSTYPFPAVTHVDGSIRYQTVSPECGLFHDLLQKLDSEYACPVLLNTSFNLRGEPLVMGTASAYACFRRAQLDALALGPFILRAQDMPPFIEDGRFPLPGED
jgi:carbamoyltransferase